MITNLYVEAPRTTRPEDEPVATAEPSVATPVRVPIARSSVSALGEE